MTVGFQKVTVVLGCLQRTLKVQTDSCDHLWMVQSWQVSWEVLFQGKCWPGDLHSLGHHDQFGRTTSTDRF